jgi:hypothetical protein
MCDQMRWGVTATHSKEFTRSLADLRPLAERGFLFAAYTITAANRRDFPGIEDNYGLAFHNREYVYRHWSAFLNVVAYIDAPDGNRQDQVVLSRRATGPGGVS